MQKRKGKKQSESHAYSVIENRNAGYEDRFGKAGMKGSHRYLEYEPETYGSRGFRDSEEDLEPARPALGDYSSFDGPENHSGASAPIYQWGRQNGGHADDRKFDGVWMRGEHFGKGPKGYQRSDERIYEEVCQLLAENGDIDASEIEVNVTQGEVTLSGFVDSRRVKRITEDVVERISGVQDIFNQLQILKPNEMAEQKSSLAGSTGDEMNISQGSVHSGRSTNKDRASRTKPSRASRTSSNKQMRLS